MWRCRRNGFGGVHKALAFRRQGYLAHVPKAGTRLACFQLTRLQTEGAYTLELQLWILYLYIGWDAPPYTNSPK